MSEGGEQVAKYRAILLFDATDDKAAAKLAATAVAAVRGKLDRLTTRTESWGAVDTTSE